MHLRRLLPAGAAALVLVAGSGSGPAAPVRVAADGTFAMGIPTSVDPVRGVGEPDISVPNDNNPFVSGPAGSSTQTSFFWNSRDGGQSFYQKGPHNGHWLCPAVGGGDSINVVDKVNNDQYVIDQESLAQLGLGKIDGTTGQLSAQCANGPGLTADRPFLAILHPSGGVSSPQSTADGGKAITYLSYQCNGCQGQTVGGLETGSTGSGGGGLAYAWTDDGVTYIPAEPGVVGNNPITNTAQLSSSIANYQFHGNMVADPVTGDVFTAITCSTGSCPNASGGNEFGIAVGVPPATPSAANPGQFDTLTYQTAVSQEADGSPIPSTGSLFPTIAIDSARTLYLSYIQGKGTDSTTPLTGTDFHMYYAYSTCVVADKCTHKTWSKPIQVDHGAATATSTFGWITAGDKGKVGFVWLGTDVRQHPSLVNPDKRWFPFTAVTVNGDSPTPTFQQARVGLAANHLSDICLYGTLCAQPDSTQMSLRNRNMADFISADIGPDGALQIIYADDANHIATLPTTLLPGLPVTHYARQVSGPRLRGSGSLADARFGTAPVAGIGDVSGDALFPVDGGGTNVPQLDLTGSSLGWNGSALSVHIPVASLASLASPDTSDQTTVWWVTTWKYADHVYFAKASSAGGAAPTFTAGLVSSFDRVGICTCTSPTLVDYSGGTTVTGARNGNAFDITVPASVVGAPTTGAELLSVAAYTMLDNGRPLSIGPSVTTNTPTIVDATPSYNRLLALTTPATTAPGAQPGQQVTGSTVITGNPNTSAVRASGGAAAAVVAVGGLLWVARRRRTRTGR